MAAAALHAEREAVDAETQQRFSDEARRTYEVLKAEELARKACGRLKKVDADARKRGVDIHRHLAAIEHEIGLAEKLVWPTTPAPPAFARGLVEPLSAPFDPRR